MPRLLTAVEWEALRPGLLQRARALNAFLPTSTALSGSSTPGSCRGGCWRAPAAMSRRWRDCSTRRCRRRLSPASTSSAMPRASCWCSRTICGCPPGRYALAAREAVAPALGAARGRGRSGTTSARWRGDPRRRPGRSRRPGGGDPLRRSRRRRLLRAPAARARTRDPDRRAGRARDLARPPLRPPGPRADPARRPLPPPRRGPADDPDGGLTALGELLLPALESGRLRCVNAFGTGLADDKLAHAYAESMVRFYLGEEPLLRSVPSFDLSDETARAAALGRIEELVVKPRDGFGGHGRDDHAAGDRAAAAAGDRPGAAAPRGLHRPGDGPALQPPDGLRRPAAAAPGRPPPLRRQRRRRRHGDGRRPHPLRPRAGEMIVNSSRGGGCKDTWVVDVPAAGRR